MLETIRKPKPQVNIDTSRPTDNLSEGAKRNLAIARAMVRDGYSEQKLSLGSVGNAESKSLDRSTVSEGVRSNSEAALKIAGDKIKNDELVPHHIAKTIETNPLHAGLDTEEIRAKLIQVTKASRTVSGALGEFIKTQIKSGKGISEYVLRIANENSVDVDLIRVGIEEDAAKARLVDRLKWKNEEANSKIKLAEDQMDSLRNQINEIQTKEAEINKARTKASEDGESDLGDYNMQIHDLEQDRFALQREYGSYVVMLGVLKSNLEKLSNDDIQ